MGSEHENTTNGCTDFDDSSLDGDEPSSLDAANLKKHNDQISRHVFTTEEKNVLIRCIKAEHKYIFPEETYSSTIQDRKLAWIRVLEAYNNKFPDYPRTLKMLKKKLFNMKRPPPSDGFQNRNDVGINVINCDEISYDSTEGLKEQVNLNREKCRRTQSLTPKQTRILKQCILAEKKYIFDVSNYHRSWKNRKDAWYRIMRAYNKIYPNDPRSIKQLQKKFYNLKQAKAFSDFERKNSQEQYKLMSDNGMISDNAKMFCTSEELEEMLTSKLGNSKDSVKLRLVSTESLLDPIKSSLGGCTDSETSNSHLKNQQNSKFRRAQIFTPQECDFLNECMKSEKKIIHLSSYDRPTIKLKQLAWNRITDAFNRKFPHTARSTKMIKKKYSNMIYRNCRDLSIGVNGAERNDIQQFADESEQKCGSNDESGCENDEIDETPVELGEVLNEDQLDVKPDPLISVLNGYVYNESQRNKNCCAAEEPEIIKLKLDLLSRQIENAKMERHRISAAIKGEAEERHKRDKLLNLQIQEAELKLAAAERQKADPSMHAPLLNSQYKVP